MRSGMEDGQGEEMVSFSGLEEPHPCTQENCTFESVERARVERHP